jgi:hypothetical protein
MRHLSTVVALTTVFLTASLSEAFAQGGSSKLSITNYQLVTETRSTRTVFFETYSASLLDIGPALPGATATATSLAPSVQIVPGQGTLRFGPVLANGTVASTNTFTIQVDRSVPFDFSFISWSFTNPVANPGPDQTTTVGTTVTLNGSGSSSPNGPLTYSWSFQSVPPGSKAVLSNANSPMATFVVDVQGTYDIQLKVTNNSGSDTAIVHVSTVNSPPVANAGPNQTVTLGSTVTLDGSKSTDVDGDPITYMWSFVSMPAGSHALLFNVRTVSPQFIADVAGQYIIQLVVNDGKVDSPAVTVTVTTAATPPVANAGPNQTVTLGTLVQLNGSGSTDVNGKPLTYLWSFNSIPSGSSATLSNPTIVNPTFTADRPGTYLFSWW